MTVASADAPRTARAAAGVGAVTALSRVVGFARILVVATVLGITDLGNAFQSANSVSNVLFELVAAGALSAVLVPAFVDLLDAGDDEAAEEVAGGVLGVAMAALGAIALVAVLASPLLARLLTVGVDSDVAAGQRRLVTFLLCFFVPQVVLYAWGAVATGVLYAKRRFIPTAAAPIGNTLVMVAALLLFSAVAGGSPGLDLSLGEKLLLVLAGTGGVVAFVGTLALSCRATGFRLRPRWLGRDPRVGRVLRQAGWGVVLHSSAGVLLGGAVIAGAAVKGGVVAYQSAWVFFLAPYAVFAQPIQTTILPELVTEVREHGMDRYRRSVRWALERTALPTLPLAALLVALAGPGIRTVVFGRATANDGAHLVAVAVAALAIGLLPYSAFLLLARAAYALGDSRTPGLIALVVAAVGAVIMAIGAPLTQGSARIVVLGLAHSVAHLVGTVLLLRYLRRRVGGSVFPAVIWPGVAIVTVVGVGMYLAADAMLGSAHTRTADLVVSAVVGCGGAALMVLLYRVTGLAGRLSPRVPVDVDDVPAIAPIA